MKNRYKNTFNKTVSPFFGTFHGLFYKILLREGYKINIIESGKCHSIIRVILSKYFDDVNDDKIREVLNNISLFKTSLGNIENFKPTISNEIFKECYEQYEEYKAKEQLWDFDDLSIRVLYLLKNNERILNGYRELFKYVLVDEFQDCDELQIEFIKLINQGNELFAVGDEDQCIYSFRGSKPKYMVDFHSSFKNGKKVYLTTNYRSKKNIVDISKKLICNNIGRNKKEIISYENEKGIIKFLKPYNEYVQGEEIANIIKKIVGESYSNNAILYRTNIEARSLIDSFTRRKIPFILLDKGYNFFEHFICKDIINYLTLSIDPFNKVAFNSIINKPFRYISKSNLSYVSKYEEHKNVFDILIDKNDTAPFQAKKLNELKEENGESVNDTYIYLDIPDAERLESMYFGFKQYGSDLASGKLEMKMGYNLDKKTILEGQKFEFENLSLAGFSQAFTGDYERDYTELNKQIYDIIKNGTSDEIKTIENNIDGLKETITITDNFMLYKLESRVYNFK